MPAFDLLIITARDREQQWLFEQRLRAMPAAAFADQVLVVADPPGPQPGSGGSSVFALCAALDALGIPLRAGEQAGPELTRQLAGRRILLVHCGGFSQRVPQFASLGKAFAPVDASDGGTLFEEVVRSLSELAAPLPAGVTIACGDVLYRASPPESLPPGAAGIAWAWPARLEQASQHGVYLWDQMTGLATQALQKPSPARLQDAGFSSRAPLDTGVLFLTPPVLSALLSPCADRSGGPARRQALRRAALWTGLDLYRDVTAALSRDGKGAVAAHEELLAPLRRFDLAVLCPADGSFVHFGTTPELQSFLTGHEGGAPALINSVVASPDARIGSGAVLHHCSLSGRVTVGTDSFGMGLRAGSGGLWLDSSRLAYQLPIRGGGREAVVVLGVGDNPKAGDGATVMGEPLQEWARARGLRADDLWPGLPADQRTLWNARIFPAGSRQHVPAALGWLQSPGEARPEGAGELLSMREIHSAFDARRWWRHESRLRAQLLARKLVAGIDRDTDVPLAELAAATPAPLAGQVLAELERLARRDRAPLHAARLWRACAEVAGDRDVGSPYHARAFACIREGINGPLDHREGTRWARPAGTAVLAKAPIRIDLAGGWTDTPPQACEWGGTVLNAALCLDGDAPVRARAEILPQPVLRFAARDASLEITIGSLEELRACQDPTDPFALHKAAFAEAGFNAGDAATLEGLLQRIGGGLLLETEARVPKGSGLGTSSILGAAVLACLYALSAQETTWEALFSGVLRLEQRMTTGGGWQDQVGGLLPGIKLTQTEAGLDQTPTVSAVTCSPEVWDSLEQRLVLFYTGVPRLARNVLQRVIDRYLAREPVVISTLRRMPELAAEIAAALRAGDLERVGAGLSESWELNKRLEPTTTNPEIDHLFAATAAHVHGAKLAGAGGGGFMVLLGRTAEDAALLRERLPQLQPTGTVHPCTLDRDGLKLQWIDG